MTAVTKIGIINVTGYAGSELARILRNHPEVTIASVTGRSAAGQRLPEAVPHLWDIDLPITSTVEESVDFVFSSLPSGASAEALAPLVDGGVKAVDIAADFRIRSAEGFKAAYKIDHPAPHLLERAVYGLPEINRGRISGASLIANPGCYPEASILALAPAVQTGLVELDAIIDAKSGISGAGRGSITSNPMYHFAESNENVLAYGLEGHGHQPEIAQELASLGGSDSAKVTFVPHLIPMTRGIFATCYAPLTDPSTTREAVQATYQEFYAGEPFTNVTASPPRTKQTTGSNLCLVYPTVDPRTGRLIVVSCLDNLVKGAAGQAVQNMNLMLGLPETMGLESLALWP